MTGLELGWAQDALDKAASNFEAEKAKLFRQDGTSKYAPVEHKEREEALFAPVQEAAERARAAAKEAQEEADKEDLLADFDPLLALAGKQADLVMVKSSIIAPAVESASLLDLARRLDAVAVHGDEVDRRLYAMHANKRVEAYKREFQRTKQLPDGFGEAATALGKLRETLVDKDVQLKLATAKLKRQKAIDLTFHVTQKLSDVTGKTERNRAEFAARMRRYL